MPDGPRATVCKTRTTTQPAKDPLGALGGTVGQLAHEDDGQGTGDEQPFGPLEDRQRQLNEIRKDEEIQWYASSGGMKQHTRHTHIHKGKTVENV